MLTSDAAADVKYALGRVGWHGAAHGYDEFIQVHHLHKLRVEGLNRINERSAPTQFRFEEKCVGRAETRSKTKWTRLAR